jgi:Flp pilus assembly protein TadG
MRAASRAGRRRGARRRGAVAAEFALLLPVLMLIVLICVDFGRCMYTFIAVRNSAEAGASFAIMNPYIKSTQAAWEAEIQDTARKEMDGQTGYTSANLTTATTVTIEETGLRRIRVVATYNPFRTIVAWPGIPREIPLQSASVLRAIR